MYFNIPNKDDDSLDQVIDDAFGNEDIFGVKIKAQKWTPHVDKEEKIIELTTMTFAQLMKVLSFTEREG